MSEMPACPKCGGHLFMSARDRQGRVSAVDCKNCGYYEEYENYVVPA